MKLISAVLLIGGLSAVAQAAPQRVVTPSSDPSVVTDEEHVELVANAFDLVSSIISNLQGDKNDDDMSSFERTKTLNKTEIGVAQIFYNQTEHICSGVHLKPWILLTTASCVQGRDPRKLLIVTAIKRRKRFGTAQSRVKEIKLHPSYNPTSPGNNFAMIYTFGKFDWNVGEFYLPRRNYTIDPVKIAHRLELTYENKTLTFPINNIETKSNKDFGLCKALGANLESFCVEKGVGRSIFYKGDIGSPLYVNEYGIPKYSLRRLIGIYTGMDIGKEMKGHIFESVYPAYCFIESFINDHPVPPFY